MQKQTQALKSVKGPGNTFDLSSKWLRTLPSLIYVSVAPEPVKQNLMDNEILESVPKTMKAKVQLLLK